MIDRIIKHIERLLLLHDCVIIPDFGGFVLQSVRAIYLGNEHSFTPTRKEIVFNPTLTHNDGLLVESYMKEYSMDFDKAQQLVSKDVASMKSSLSDSSELQLGAIGIFIKENERFIFTPGKSSDVLFSTRSFGLPIFHYLPLSARSPIMIASAYVNPNSDSGVSSEKSNKRGKNVIYSIPITRTFLNVLAVSAAVILLFLFISTPIRDVNKASYTASFIPQEIMPKKTADDIVSDAFSTLASVSVSDDSSENDSPSSSPVSSSTTTSTTTTPESSVSTTSAPKSSVAKSTSAKPSAAKSAIDKSAAVKPVAVNGGGKKFYVIICSFQSKERTQTYIKQLKGSEEAVSAGIIVRDGRARGYAQSFSNENDAQAYMKKLQQNTKHKDAWVYVDK